MDAPRLWDDPPSPKPDLASYDVILINTSGGKDSQAMLDEVYIQAATAACQDKLVAVHADLKEMEWEGVRELAAEQVTHYGIPLEIVTRRQGTLLEQIEARGKFPDSQNRYCTSQHKTGQVYRLLTQLADRAREQKGPRYRIRILNCLGFRSQESPARAKKLPYRYDEAASNTRRHVDTWYPIFDWSLEQVWERIAETGVRHHEAYDKGMSRLSCRFCVLASKGDLVRSAQLNPESAQEYLRVEKKIGHRFKNDLSMAEIIDLSEGKAL